MKKSLKQVKDRIDDRCGVICFDYQGKNGGFEQFNDERTDVWYGEDDIVVSNSDEAINTPIFNGKTFSEIWQDVEIWDF